jgi:SAM-dependent methyltransferase
MKTPHSKWADHYDSTYELSFGAMYEVITQATLEQVQLNVIPPAKIIDFGAGTGRLTIPLAKCGYQVTAVEPCIEMLNKLIEKSGELSINSFNGKTEGYYSSDKFDMALSVFTVISYLLDDDSLYKSLQAMSESLLPGGYLLIDIPSLNLFQSYSVINSLIKRNVVITPTSNNLFTYNENTILFKNDTQISFNDSFQIKYWDEMQILDLLSNNFIIKEKLSGILNNSGSSYFLLIKK